MKIRIDNTAYHQACFLTFGEKASKHFAPVPSGASCLVPVATAAALEKELTSANRLRTHRTRKDAAGKPLTYREICLVIIDDDGSATPCDAETLFEMIRSGDVK
jgi:hypothetical protein